MVPTQMRLAFTIDGLSPYAQLCCTRPGGWPGTQYSRTIDGIYHIPTATSRRPDTPRSALGLQSPPLEIAQYLPCRRSCHYAYTQNMCAYLPVRFLSYGHKVPTRNHTHAPVGCPKGTQIKPLPLRWPSTPNNPTRHIPV